MPNWVYNSVTVSGEKSALEAFAAKAAKPVVLNVKGTNVKQEDGTNKYEAELFHEDTREEDFSFWNFIAPVDEDLDYYTGIIVDPKPDGYEGWTPEQKMAHSMKFTGKDWYNWNITNWGVKWEAGEVSFAENLTSTTPSLDYSFNTAWSIPEAIFTALCEQHPELDFAFESEEEQGWGATYTSSKVDGAEDGEATSTLLLVSEYDVPQSHADYVERDREDCCNCQDDQDEDYWFDDCPRASKEFAVVIQQTFIIKAESAEKAWEITQDAMGALSIELPDGLEHADEDFIFVKDIDTEERLFPTLEEATD